MNVALWLLTDLLRVDLSVKTINVIARQANLLKSLPLNRAGRLGSYVVHHPVDTTNLIDDPVRCPS